MQREFFLEKENNAEMSGDLNRKGVKHLEPQDTFANARIAGAKRSGASAISRSFIRRPFPATGPEKKRSGRHTDSSN